MTEKALKKRVFGIKRREEEKKGCTFVVNKIYKLRFFNQKKEFFMSAKRNLSSLSKKRMPAVVVSSNDKVVRVSPLRPVVVSTRISVGCRMPFLKGISTLGISSRRNLVLDEYMRGNDYVDMARDWQCVGNDMRAVIAGWKDATRYGKK